MNKILVITLLLLITTYIFSSGNSENKGEVTLFSEFRGQITLEGEPLQGVKLTRTYPEVGSTSETSETIYTDSDGNYHFKEVTGKLGIMRFLPHEAVIHQKIEAEYNNETYLIWYTCKRNYEDLGELKYLKFNPILNEAMALAYNNGYILVNADLSSKEEIIQKVNSDILGFISITDLDFPYETSLKEYGELLDNREHEFAVEISNWFNNRPNYFDRLTDGTETISEIEREDLIPYFGAKIESVDHVEYSGYVKLEYYEEDYNTESQRLTVNGAIILNLINPEGEKFQGRVWLSDSIFKVNSNKIELLARDHYFIINSANIDPNIID